MHCPAYVDGKPIKDDGLYAIERTAAVSRLIEAGVLLDRGFEIPSGGISTRDGCIVKPCGVIPEGSCEKVVSHKLR
jgi:hypothetical protein